MQGNTGYFYNKFDFEFDYAGKYGSVKTRILGNTGYFYNKFDFESVVFSIQV